MLKLSGVASVPCFDSPFIGHEFGLMGSGVNHRFYSEDHSWFHEISRIFWCFVVDIRFFVKCYSDTMSRIFANYSVSVSFRMLGDFVSDIAESISWIHLSESYFETRSCHIDEVFAGF